MPVVVADNSSRAEPIRPRRPRNQPISASDPSPPQIPSIIQSTRSKSTISSLLLSTFTTANESTTTAATTTALIRNPSKKNFKSGAFRGLGCAAQPQVSVPAVIRTSASWEAKKARKKKQRSLQQMQNKGTNQVAATAVNNSSSASTSVVVPDVCCGPGIGFANDAASVDCVVSRRPVPGRVRPDADKMNQREHPLSSTRRIVKPEPLSFEDSDHSWGMVHSGLDLFGARYHRREQHRFPDDLEEIMMLRSSLLMGGRSDGFDRYRDWRLDVDNMSYEELLELADRIGYVSTGLKEDEIVDCLSKTKGLNNMFSQFPTKKEWKCSICQEDYEAENEVGKLECGHFYHFNCIKQWLLLKNVCPICKTEAAAQH